MSNVPTLVTQELFNYLTSHAAPEDQFLIDLKDAAIEAEIPPIWISPEQGSLMQIMLRLINAKKVVEVGTLAGYSALVMAKALPKDGKVITLEIDNEYAKFAEKWFTKSDQFRKIDIILGNAADTMKDLGADEFDAIFIDADKANYGLYLQQAVRIIRPGGMILVDNAFAFGKLLVEDHEATDDVWAIRAFNDLMAREKMVTSVIIPVGDGMWVGIKEG